MYQKGHDKPVYLEQKSLKAKILITFLELLQCSKNVSVHEPKSNTFLRTPVLKGQFSPRDMTSWNPSDFPNVGLREYFSGLFKDGGL